MKMHKLALLALLSSASAHSLFGDALNLNNGIVQDPRVAALQNEPSEYQLENDYLKTILWGERSTQPQTIRNRVTVLRKAAHHRGHHRGGRHTWDQ